MSTNVTIFANTGHNPGDVLLASSARNYTLAFAVAGAGSPAYARTAHLSLRISVSSMGAPDAAYTPSTGHVPQHYTWMAVVAGAGQAAIGYTLTPATPPYTPPAVPPQQPQAGVTATRAHLRTLDTAQAQARLATVAARLALAAVQRATTTAATARAILSTSRTTAAKGTVHR